MNLTLEASILIQAFSYKIEIFILALLWSRIGHLEYCFGKFDLTPEDLGRVNGTRTQSPILRFLL